MFPSREAICLSTRAAPLPLSVFSKDFKEHPMVLIDFHELQIDCSPSENV